MVCPEKQGPTQENDFWGRGLVQTALDRPSGRWWAHSAALSSRLSTFRGGDLQDPQYIFLSAITITTSPNPLLAFLWFIFDNITNSSACSCHACCFLHTVSNSGALTSSPHQLHEPGQSTLTTFSFHQDRPHFAVSFPFNETFFLFLSPSIFDRFLHWISRLLWLREEKVVSSTVSWVPCWGTPDHLRYRDTSRTLNTDPMWADKCDHRCVWPLVMRHNTPDKMRYIGVFNSAWLLRRTLCAVPVVEARLI